MRKVHCPKCSTRRAEIGKPYAKDNQWFADCTACGQPILLLTSIRNSIANAHNYSVAPGQLAQLQKLTIALAHCSATKPTGAMLETDGFARGLDRIGNTIYFALHEKLERARLRILGRR